LPHNPYQLNFLNVSGIYIPKPVKSDSLEKNEFLKKTRAPLPPVSSPQRPKLPAPQLPTVISPRQQQQESPPPRVESPPVESQPAIDQLKETPDTKTQFSNLIIIYHIITNLIVLRYNF
jgi:hypothetical protein